MSFRQYVCGFLFSPDGGRVALIRKRRPYWQAGLLNGIGGKVEPGESPAQAIVREFQEEAGVLIPQWELFAVLTGRDGQVRFYTARDVLVEEVSSCTDERVHVYTMPEVCLSHCMVPTLRFLLPLALDTRIVKPVQFRDEAAW